MIQVIKTSLIITLALLLSSCSIERRLAGKYVENLKPGAVLLLAPDIVYRNSFKIPDIDNFDSLTKVQQDSVLYFNSDIVQFCEDSIYIETFMEAFSRGLQSFGFSVFYQQPVDQFLNNERATHIINVAQFQLEEFYHPVTDETSFDPESVNNFELSVTAINMNNWLDLSKVNHEQLKTEMLYSTHTIYDDFKGDFRYYPFTGKVDYLYSIDSLTIEKLYSAAHNLGWLHANWLFDYLMNQSVKENMPSGLSPTQLYSYDHQTRSFRRIYKNVFVPIK